MDTGGGCRACRRPAPDVARRGRLRDQGPWCDGCWARYANELATQDGATDRPWPGPGPDDTTRHEPARCDTCEELVVPRRTDYDRWVHLDLRQHPAEEVPPPHRWIVRGIRARHSAIVVAYVALPAACCPGPLPERVHCPHRIVCPARQPLS